MCGIAGLITFSGELDKLKCCVQTMTDAQKHRGPDDAGLDVLNKAEPLVIFGHRRLAIIDLSPAGHQPMCDIDTGNWITFNGEIYNFKDLRKELEHHGQMFRTQTDTEVILKAYAVWGTACVRHLRGIFAFAIWQPTGSRTDPLGFRLFLARDQLGVKPLYYWLDRDANVLLFASEVRALLASGVVSPRLDLHGLRSYLAYGSVQEPHTLVDGIHSLLPGHTLTFQNGQIQLQRYWRLPAPESVGSEPPIDLFDQMGNYLTEAVRVQLVADVPLGAFLSGGIDSTAIAALMKRADAGPVKTFSVVFREQDFDERIYSQAAARHIGTEHTELLMTGDIALQTFPRALEAFDQPSVDGLNTYFISKAVREAGLTVALSGVGGDELFGGYEGYRKTMFVESLGRRLQSIPAVARLLLVTAISLLPLGETGRKAVTLLQNERHPYFTSRQVFSRAQVASLLGPDFLFASEDWEPKRFSQLDTETAGYDSINRASALELQTYMLSTLLRDTDQMSMAHALEVRVPLLDHILVEFLFTLPGHCKLDPRQPKPLLTRALNNGLPDVCIHRPKHGFELPFEIWLRKSLEAQIRSSFLEESEACTAPFTSSGLAQVWKQFNQGKLNWSRIWMLFVLREWLERHKISI